MSERFTITLESRDGLGIAGLKRFLKMALRVYGLRCISVRRIEK